MKSFALFLMATVMVSSCSNESELDFRSDRAAIDHEGAAELSLVTTAALDFRFNWSSNARPTHTLVNSEGEPVRINAQLKILNQNNEVVDTDTVGAGGLSNYLGIVRQEAKIE